MMELEYDVRVEYERCGTELTPEFSSSVLSKPFLSQAVQMVGVFERVRALDPLSPLIRAVTPISLTWSYMPL